MEIGKKPALRPEIVRAGGIWKIARDCRALRFVSLNRLGPEIGVAGAPEPLLVRRHPIAVPIGIPDPNDRIPVAAMKPQLDARGADVIFEGLGSGEFFRDLSEDDPAIQVFGDMVLEITNPGVGEVLGQDVAVMNPANELSLLLTRRIKGGQDQRSGDQQPRQRHTAPVGGMSEELLMNQRLQNMPAHSSSGWRVKGSFQFSVFRQKGWQTVVPAVFFSEN